MQYFLQLCNNAELYCYIVHFMLHICKMCPYTILKQGSFMIKFIFPHIRITKKKKQKSMRKFVYFKINKYFCRSYYLNKKENLFTTKTTSHYEDAINYNYVSCILDYGLRTGSL